MRDLAMFILVGAMRGCSDETGSSGAGGSGGAGGAAALQDEYILSDQELVPESGFYDPVGRAFYVGSRTEGSITRVDADGTETIFFDPPPSSSLRTLGITIDANARRLWVCAQGEGSPGAGVWTFDLSTGDLEIEFDLATAAPDATCNDIALDSAGLAYVSDSSNPRIYRANAGDGTVAVWADDPLLAPEADGLGGNGIAVTEDDAFVILSKTLGPAMTPRLLRIDRTDPQSIGGITTTPELSGLADGMSFLGGDLYLAIVSSGQISRLTNEDDQPLTPPFRIYRIDLASFE